MSNNDAVVKKFNSGNWMKMPKNDFGNSSTSFHKKPDASLFVLKPRLRTIHLESDIQEDFDMKNQFKLRNLPCPQKTEMRFVNFM